MFKKTLALIGLTLSVSANAAYQLDIRVQAGAANDNPIYLDKYTLVSNDDITSASYDSRIISGSPFRPGTAEARVEADLAKGILRTYAEATNSQVASARASMSDTVYFDLPDGVSSTMVDVTLTIDGTLTGSFSNNSLDEQYLTFQGIGLSGAFQAKDSIRLLDMSTPYTLSITYEVQEGFGYFLRAGIGGAMNLGGTLAEYGLIDLSNTAFLDLSLEEGVTFTSASGVLLTSPVPIPAAAWLFGSALVGLVGVARRKKA